MSEAESRVARHVQRELEVGALNFAAESRDQLRQAQRRPTRLLGQRRKLRNAVELG